MQEWTGVSKAARENVRNGPKLNVTVIFLLDPRSWVQIPGLPGLWHLQEFVRRSEILHKPPIK